MAFIGVEFEENSSDGGGIAVVSSSWFTPRKKELFWPPYKKQEAFNKAVKKSECPDEECWKLYKIDDYEKALKKIKLAELNSDVQSDADVCEGFKRSRRPPRRLYDDDTSEEEHENCSSENLIRPPAVKKIGSYIKTKTSQEVGTSRFSHPNFQTTSHSTYVGNDVLNSVSCQEAGSSRYSHHSTPSITSVEGTPRSTYPTKAVLNSGDLSKAFQEKIKSLLAQVKEQNSQIIGLLNKQASTSNLGSGSLPDDFPVDLPLTCQEDLLSLEEYLMNKENFTKVSLYLKTLGGKDLISKTNNVLKRCLSNCLASTYNYMGKRQEKLPFRDLMLNKLIICAIKSASELAAEREIEDIIKTWLKHAPQRNKLEAKRRNK